MILWFMLSKEELMYFADVSTLNSQLSTNFHSVGLGPTIFSDAVTTLRKMSAIIGLG